MGFFVFLIIVIIVFSRIKKSAKVEKGIPNVQPTQSYDARPKTVNQQYNPQGGMSQMRMQAQQQNHTYQMNDQQRMADTKSRLEQKYGSQIRSARQQLENVINANLQPTSTGQPAKNSYQAPAARPAQGGRPAGANDIVQKAKMNNAKLQSDETLNQIEAAHQHTEKMEAKAVEHSAACHSQGQELVDVPSESMFGSVEDLMVKGYSGDLSFERDFVSEATDMLTAFTLGNKLVG